MEQGLPSQPDFSLNPAKPSIWAIHLNPMKKSYQVVVQIAHNKHSMFSTEPGT